MRCVVREPVAVVAVASGDSRLVALQADQAWRGEPLENAAMNPNGTNPVRSSDGPNA